MNARTPTMISLFSGAGGLDIGLEAAGFVSLAVNELEPHACETLRQNKALNEIGPEEFGPWFEQNIASQRCYSGDANADLKEKVRVRLQQAAGKRAYLAQAEIVCGDIRAVSSQALMDAASIEKSELFLIAGGPPCQPFSRAGKRETVETDDGRLFLEFVQKVSDIRPRWFLFENVKGLAQSRTVVAYAECASCKATFIVPFATRQELLASKKTHTPCLSCGHAKAKVVLHEEKGGSLRIIRNEFERAGYQCHAKILNSANFGVPQSRERLFIVGSRDGEAFTWPEPTHAEDDTGQQQIFGAKLKPWVTIKDILWQDGHPEYGRLDFSQAVLWVKNVVRPHAEPVTWSLDRPSPTVGAHQGAKLAIAPHGVPEAQLARQQWHTLGKRQGDSPPVFVEHRMLTDEELLRLQTFPPNWHLHGTRMERAFQIGNAVPPVLAKVVGEAILAASK